VAQAVPGGAGASSNVAASTRRAKIDFSSVYKLRRADPGFARAWFEALCEGYDNLEMHLLHRLREGELDGGGAKAKARRKFDNATAFRLLAAHRASVNRERGRNDYTYEDQLLTSINNKLETMSQRAKSLPDLRVAGMGVVIDADGE
jgi:hypothetical protein